MTGAMLRIPAGEAGDSSDVAVALEVAGALWDKGDNEEAIRWLKRAIDAASEAGDATRATNLRQASADLEASIESRRDLATKSVPVAPPPVLSDAPTNGGGASRPPPVAPVSPFALVAGTAATPAAWGHDVRMRVAVKTSVRDPGLLLIRGLADGQRPPAGTREGFLVLADAESDADPRPSSNGGGGR